MRFMPLIALGVVTALGCSRSSGSDEHGSERRPLEKSALAQQAHVDLTGAGATFPYPLYSKWISVYEKVRPEVKINYQSIGSGGGIRQITERTVDFGASDAPMTDDELSKAPGPILHIPTTLGAVTVTYNMPALKQPLRLSPDVVAGVFLGEISKWNDPKLAALNPGVKLPDAPITVVHRSDGSGTTAIFTEFLSATVPRWKQNIGAGKTVNFPVGLGAKGNEGVAGQLKTSPGSLGYVELAYALETKQPYASIQNQAGQFVEPSLDGITAAAASLADKVPADMRMFIVNAPGPNAYPISGFTYLLVYRNQSDPAKGKALAEFLWWAVHDGQQYGPPLHYAKLPPATVSRVEEELRSMRANDQPLLKQP
jgi:phosphate transport system substrate-binding protein